MRVSDSDSTFELSRRKLLAAAGAAVAAGSLAGSGPAGAALAAAPSSGSAKAPPVHGLHLQFGADASSEMVVSWHTLQPVGRPRVVLGRLNGEHDRTTPAAQTSYTDAKSNQIVYAYHAR